jgi:branched-chain amino acid transport system permease protein
VTRAVVITVVAVLAAALPLLISAPFVLHIATQALIWALLASSWDLLSGYTGQVSFGHAAFFAIGAYAAALGVQDLGLNPYVALVFGAVVTGVIGGAVGFPALRVRGHYLALVTLGFGEIVQLVATNWQSLTGGPFGLHDFGTFAGLPRDAVAEQQISYGLVLCITVSVMLLLAVLVRRTRLGPMMLAIREDQVLAGTLGINVARYKVLGFALSSSVAGLAGGLFAFYVQLVDPQLGSSGNSAIIIAMAVFGGIGTIWGPFVGALLLYGATEAMRFVGVVYNLMAIGLVIIVFVILVPRGLASLRWPARGRSLRADAARARVAAGVVDVHGADGSKAER